MITDPEKIHLDDPGHPKVCNVCAYYKVFAPERHKEVSDLCGKGVRGCIKCKQELIEILTKRLTPIREKREKLLNDKAVLLDILKKGNELARSVASGTMGEVRKKVGVFHDL